MAHPENALSIPSKHRGERPNGHSATIREQASDEARKEKKTRVRPYGIVPSRIARVERHLEALLALKDDEKIFARSASILDILERHEYHVNLLYARREISFECFERDYKKVRALRRKLMTEILMRRRQLREQIIPEVQSLCTQADRDAA